MTIFEVCNFLNFYVQKERGSYFSFEELTEALDRAQMAEYSDLYASYATSQRSQDALAPFLANFNYTQAGTVSGLIILTDASYLSLLDITAYYTPTGRSTPTYVSIPIVNKDERAMRLNSQVNPVSLTNPIAEMSAPIAGVGYPSFRTWPVGGLTGFISYFRRPAKPVCTVTLISGRVPVYNSAASTQLEWREPFLDSILIKTLLMLGVNMGDDKTVAFSAMKSEANFNNTNNG